MPKPSNVPRPTELIPRSELNNDVLYYIFEAAYMIPVAYVPVTRIEEYDSTASTDHILVNGRGPLSRGYDVRVLKWNNVINFQR